MSKWKLLSRQQPVASPVEVEEEEIAAEVATSTPVAEVKPEVASTIPVPVEVPVAVSGPSKPVMRKFRTLNERTISWRGATTTMPAGEIVDESSYGSKGIDRLREQGVQLEEVA